MWEINSSLTEIILRALFIYFGLFIFFRICGKKQLGEMSPFDLVLILIISESVSNALGAQEDSITGGLVSAGTLLFISAAMDYFGFKSKKFEKLVEGESRILIRDGKLDMKICESERITPDEVAEALREFQIENLSDVRIGFIETNGRITAFKKI